jgi:hypothetical protein
VGSLPEAFLPLTIDVAPSDAQRVYVSARVGPSEDYVSVLFRSDDGGATFARASTIPETENLRYGFIAGVHPNNPDLLYVRVSHPEGTRLLRSEDGGISAELVFTGAGSLLGFAITGDELATGGPMDGLWVGDPEGGALERVSDVGALCLTYGPDGLYACADAATDGFSLGRSRDSGQSFEPVLKLSELCGPVSCGSDTQVAKQCPFEWREVARRLGTTCGVDDSASPGSGQSDSGGLGDGGGSCAVGRRSALGGKTFVSSLLMLGATLLARLLRRLNDAGESA